MGEPCSQPSESTAIGEIKIATKIPAIKPTIDSLNGLFGVKRVCTTAPAIPAVTGPGVVIASKIHVKNLVIAFEYILIVFIGFIVVIVVFDCVYLWGYIYCLTAVDFA